MDGSKPKEIRIKTKEQAVRALELFCERIDRIKNYSFFREPITVKREWSAKTGILETIYEGPSDEQIDAVLLHLRLFTAGNENFSIKFFYQCFDLISPRQELLDEIDSTFKIRNDWQQEPSRIGSLTKNALFGALVFGGRAHANDKNHVALYSDISGHEIIEQIENSLISEIIDQHFSILYRFYLVVKKILGEI